MRPVERNAVVVVDLPEGSGGSFVGDRRPHSYGHADLLHRRCDDYCFNFKSLFCFISLSDSEAAREKSEDLKEISIYGNALLAFCRMSFKFTRDPHIVEMGPLELYKRSPD